MELSSITQQLLHQSKQQQTETLAKLVETGVIKPNTTLPALVGKVIQLSQEQQQQLIRQWLAPNKSPNSAEPQESQQKLQTLLSKTHLVSAELKLFKAHQLVITDQRLSPGQQVQVRIRPDGQLQLQQTTPLKQSHNRAADALNGPKPAPLPIGAQTDSRLENLKQPEGFSRPNKILDTRGTTEISSLLRQNLPIEKSVALVINHFSKLVKISASLPTEKQQQILEPKAWAAIKEIAQKPFTPQQLALPRVIKQAISQSGFYPEEGKHIKQPGSSQITHAKTSEPQDLRSALTLIETLTKSVNTSATSGQNQRPNVNSNALFNALTHLQGLSPKNVEFQRYAKSFRNQINTHAQAALARISNLQLNHLIQTSSDTSLSSTGGIFEIPVRTSDNILPLTIYLQEKWYIEPEKEEARNKSGKRQQKLKKQWRVFMEFELEETGKLASEITVRDEKVSTVFWASDTELRNRAEDRLGKLKEKLEASGISVSDLTVSNANPPQKPMQTQYSLVDVTT